jgi:hypothetical protein
VLPYIAYNLGCLAIYLMPIPLTPPDDEAWYWYTRLHGHLQGLLLLLYLFIGPPAFVVIFDYVNIMTMSTT